MLEGSWFPKRTVGVRASFELGVWVLKILMMLTMMMMIRKSLKRPCRQDQADKCLGIEISKLCIQIV